MFSGGKRHYEIMADLLPAGAEWIDITVPLAGVFMKYERYDDIVIFASGDPLFYGFANTVQRECPDVGMKIYPSFNSLQMLAHRLNMPYNDMHVVSLTGRPWDKFDEALINGESLIGCLTDKKNTPQAIMQRMLDYGYDNYKMFVGENLGNEETECVGEYEVDKIYSNPNCLILQQTHQISNQQGIPDQYFNLLNGRAKMITKMPIRLTTLAVLELSDKKSFWDIGFCTGSISIEAKIQNPKLHVTAFEIREEGRELMTKNSQRFHVPGIEFHIGDFCEMDISYCEAPDAVFIGGHGGRMKEIVHKVKGVLQPDGCIVFNSVSKESQDAFVDAVLAEGMIYEHCYQITVDDNNPITILKAYTI